VVLIPHPSKHRNRFYPPEKVVTDIMPSKPVVTCPSCGMMVADYPTLDAHLLEVHPNFMASMAERIESQPR
jgi:hypothetical protein